MKTRVKHFSPLPALIAGLVLILAGPVTAQVFKTLHTFSGGSDGANPIAGIILSGSTLYGTAVFGGSSGYGTLFAINTNGTGFRVLVSFNGGNNEAYPLSGLLLSGNTLYGASSGPGSTLGALFAVNTNGTGFTTLHVFTLVSGSHYTNSDGGVVAGTLRSSGNTLYGASDLGGSGGNGNVFAVNTNGTGFTTLHSFTATSVARHGAENPPYTNSDGAGPGGGVILSGDTLYGMTQFGGSSGWGTVFAINTNGTGFTTLHTFSGGSDGGWPYTGPLILSGNTLYGTTMRGGSASGNSGNGTVFAVNTDGTGFTNLHIFTATNSQLINTDGAAPSGGVILSGNTLYGTTVFGGSSGNGTVFALNTDGTGFTTLHSFAGRPNLSTGLISSGAGLVLSGNTLYGTTYSGGTYGDGTVFSLSFRPQLSIIPSETNVILSWPTNYAGFDYTGYTWQSTTNLGSSAVWATNSPAPVVVNGQNTVTNSISGSQQFYRLIQ
jgi:uncharacterized repeat protein (TIGR03803 family)